MIDLEVFLGTFSEALNKLHTGRITKILCFELNTRIEINCVEAVIFDRLFL